MKLIEMEKVLSELCLSHKDIIYIDKNETAEHIRKIPSIDIVRCKECKHAFNVEGEWICNHLSGMAGLNVVVKADDFCSYGEREGE